MAGKIKFTCDCCGKLHEGWPVLAFDAPTNYFNLSASDKDRMAEPITDFCIIRHPDQTDRFIRATLSQSVQAHCQTLEYGIWVSLSEKSFNDYAANFHQEDYESTYFGWLCNNIPGYEHGTMGVPTSVYVNPGGQRPSVVPHEDFDHPFVHDYLLGITNHDAEERIRQSFNRLEKSQRKKNCWKFW